MQQYRMSKSVRNSWAAWPIMIAIMLAVHVGDLWSRIQQDGFFTRDNLLIFGILFVIATAAALSSCLYSRTVYEADENEIVKRTVLGETRIQWREVEKVAGGETKFAPVTLTDH